MTRVPLVLAAVAAIGAGGLGFAAIEDVRATDPELAAALASASMTERLLNGDILDGRSDLGEYADPIARGEATLAAIRARHPFGSIIRAGGFGEVAQTYAGMRRNLELYHHGP